MVAQGAITPGLELPVFDPRIPCSQECSSDSGASSRSDDCRPRCDLALWPQDHAGGFELGPNCHPGPHHQEKTHVENRHAHRLV